MKVIRILYQISMLIYYHWVDTIADYRLSSKACAKKWSGVVEWSGVLETPN